MKIISQKKLSSMLSLIRVKAVKRDKMFSMTPKTIGLLKSRLSIPYKALLALAMGRITGLGNRVLILNHFIRLILRLQKDHGADFTIKWLKACYVALQKSLGDDHLVSLRSLEPKLPLPRLINGIPSIIQSRDRELIREGHRGVIIFWSSLFSIYRILKCSYKLKVASITDDFTGDIKFLESLKTFAGQRTFFEGLEGYNSWLKTLKLAPRVFVMSKRASPSHSVAWHGLLWEIYALYTTDPGNAVRANLFTYLDCLGRSKFNVRVFQQRLADGWQIVSRIMEGPYSKEFGFQYPTIPSAPKGSSVGPFGQLSLKEEPAGKLRIFAIVDAVTQSALEPLNAALFQLLSKIPNDGTFDQDASVKRSQIKASRAGCAYSFDLSSATDRLPATLSSAILSRLVGVEGLGDAWLRLLVDRTYFFSPKQWEEYAAPTGVPQGLKYSVGQPMGALSSWAMLAITHHFILQYCAFNLAKASYSWNEQYEILGDDLVVFDKALADSYLQVAKSLGVEINLTKSIQSHSKPVFEFAKRTCIGLSDVSPIPFRQLLTTSLADKVGLFLSMSSRGLISHSGQLLRLLSRFGTTKLSLRELGNPILAILGAYVSRDLLPHRWLVESLIEPNNDEFSFEDSPFSLPLRSLVNLVLKMIPVANEKEGGKQQDMLGQLSYPYSSEESRKEVYEDYEPEFANVIANRALVIAKSLENNYDQLITDNSRALLGGWYKDKDFVPVFNKTIELLKGDVGLLGGLEGWFEENLLDWNKGLDVTDAVDEIATDPAFYYRHGLTISHATSMLEKIESLDYKFRLAKAPYGSFELESAGVIVNLNKVVKGSRSRFWE